MEHKEKDHYLLQGVRVPQESASNSDTVPVRATSSSDEGLGEALPTGAQPQRTTAEEKSLEKEVEIIKVVEREKESEERKATIVSADIIPEQQAISTNISTVVYSPEYPGDIKVGNHFLIGRDTSSSVSSVEAAIAQITNIQDIQEICEVVMEKSITPMDTESATMRNKRKRNEDRSLEDSDEEISSKRDKESATKDSDEEKNNRKRNTRRFPDEDSDDVIGKSKTKSDKVSSDLHELQQQHSASPATIQRKRNKAKGLRWERIQEKRNRWKGEMRLKGRETPGRIRIGKVEIGRRLGRPRKSLKPQTQKIGAEVINQTVMSQIGRIEEEIDVELLKIMTASDIGSQIIDYVEDIEVIRARSRNRQGTLSGEMKKRLNYVKEAVRALQEKADEKGDPQILRQKIEDLKEEIKERKREEERRDRDVSEMKDTIQKLKDENKSIKDEMRKIKYSVERKESLEREYRERREREDTQGDLQATKLRKKEDTQHNVKAVELNKKEDTKPYLQGGKEKRSLMALQVAKPIKKEDVKPSLQDGKEKRSSMLYLQGGKEERSPMSSSTPVEMEVDTEVYDDDNTDKTKYIPRKKEDFPALRPSLGGKPPVQLPDNEPQRNNLEERKKEVEKGGNIEMRKGDGKDTGRKEEGKPRIKSNVQVKKPYSERKKEDEEDMSRNKEKNKDKDKQEEQDYPMEGEGWKTVENKKDKKKKEKILLRGEAKNIKTPGTSQGKDREVKGKIGPKDKDKERIRKKKLPKAAAISIRGKSDTFSYAEALKKARSKIKLEDLQIDAPIIRKSIAGATIIEITGIDNSAKADKLAEKLSEVLREEAYVSRPTIKAELRLSGMDESVFEDEVKEVIAKEGKCDISEVKTGVIQKTRNGNGVVWVRCPLPAALSIAQIGKIKIGWSIVSVELLKNRPIQCFRCWRYGHVKSMCRFNEDYTGYCFRCGEQGHTIVQRDKEGIVIDRCSKKSWCILCAKIKRDPNHRIGSVNCEGIRTRGKQLQPQVRKSESTDKDKNIPDAERRTADKQMDIE